MHTSSLEEEDHPIWSVSTSTATGTLQPLSPRISEDSPPGTTPTAQIFGYPTEESMKSDAGIDERVQSFYETKSFHSSPSLLPSQPSDRMPQSVQPNDDAQLANLLAEVTTLQEDTFNQRTHARDLRNRLRQHRQEEKDMRVALARNLNSANPEETISKTMRINEAIEDLQAAADYYLVLEDEYNEVEDALAQKEYHLDQHMARLTSILHKETSLLTQRHPINVDSSSSSSVHHDAVDSNAQEFSPETAEYISLAEDVRFLRSKADEIARGEGEYRIIRDQQLFREDNGLPLDDDAKIFIDQYEDERDDVNKELKAALVRLENHSEHKRPHDNTVTDDEWRKLFQEYLPDPPEDQPPPDSLRASEADDRSPFFESARPLPLNKSTFINHWLLYRLRHSAIEVLRFKSQPELLELVDEGWDRDGISQMAMELWYQDGTTKEEALESLPGVW